MYTVQKGGGVGLDQGGVVHRYPQPAYILLFRQHLYTVQKGVGVGLDQGWASLPQPDYTSI